MKRRALALAIVVLLTIGASCLVSTLVMRGSLAHARDRCDALAIGLPRADAEQVLATELGASVLGWSGTVAAAATADEVSVGRRGAIASWECELSIDSTGALARTRFHWWIAPDFHGGWDDEARVWLEAHFL